MLAPARPRSTESKYRILYLGSDLKFITAVRKALSEPVYRLVACSDPESATLFLRSNIQYDLLLIDLKWQGKEGLKPARVARSLRHRKRMPIVLLSPAKVDHQTRTLAQKAGVVECALKTQDIGEVTRRVIGDE